MAYNTLRLRQTCGFRTWTTYNSYGYETFWFSFKKIILSNPVQTLYSTSDSLINQNGGGNASHSSQVKQSKFTWRNLPFFVLTPTEVYLLSNWLWLLDYPYIKPNPQVLNNFFKHLLWLLFYLIHMFPTWEFGRTWEFHKIWLIFISGFWKQDYFYCTGNLV